MVFVYDSFTDTDGVSLGSHIGETGATWSPEFPFQYAGMGIKSNTARLGTYYPHYSASGVPTCADYGVRTSIRILAISNAIVTGVLARVQPGTGNWYQAHLSIYGGSTWYLSKYVGGSPSVLGSSPAPSAGIGSSFVLELLVVGSTLTVIVDGTPIIVVEDHTYTSKGRAGIASTGFDTDASFDNFMAYDAGACGGSGYSSGYVTSYSGGCPNSDDLSLRERVHRLAAAQHNDVLLYYWRDNLWQLCPSQPTIDNTDPIIIEHTYRQPTTAEFTLLDRDGSLVPENMESLYNYKLDGITYDPLIDEARKIRLTGGIFCFDSLTHCLVPTSSLTPSSGSLSQLTDGLLDDNSISTSKFVKFVPPSTSDFTITVDLGSLKWIRHACCRFGTKDGVCSLPAYVTFQVSSDGINYKSWPRKPVGGVNGDWDESRAGQVIEMVRTDIDESARYVRITITPETASQTIFMDEIDFYGGYVGGTAYHSIFTGFLGDDVDVSERGYIKIRATGMLKKLADNNEVRLTQQYGGGAGPVELADILYLLLTSASYWHGNSGDYDAPFSSDEILWAYGSNYTRFQLPVWQGQSNNMLGYGYELAGMIGWELYEDPDGRLGLREPPYRQIMPDQVFVAAPDGNGELRHCERQRTGKDMRNIVEVSVGDGKFGGQRSIRINPTSVGRYGRRRVIITDPILATPDLRQKAGDYILRDYAFRLSTLSNEISNQFETSIKNVYGFRTGYRPHLHSKSKTGSYAQELWSMERMQEHITRGQWMAQCDYIPYVPSGPPSPINVIATPDPMDNTIITVTWDPPSDTTDLYGYRVYMSSSGAEGPYNTSTLYPLPTSGSVDFIDLTPAQQYWFYVVSLGPSPAYTEGSPSTVVTAVAGAGAGDDSGWTVTDLTVDLTDGPIAQNGYEQYVFHFLWTSPANGFKHAVFCLAIGVVPSDPTIPGSWIYGDEWHGDLVPAGKTWDYVTDGQLDFYVPLRTDVSIPGGTTVYVRMFTWMNTHDFDGPPHASNIASIVL